MNGQGHNCAAYGQELDFDFFELFDLIVSSSATTAEKLIAIIHARHIGKKGEPAYPSRNRVETQSSTSTNTYQRALPVVRVFFDVERRRGRATKYGPNPTITASEIENAIAGLRPKSTPHKSIPQNGVNPKSTHQNGAAECPKMGQQNDSLKKLTDADENARALSDLSYYRDRLENAANGALVNIAGASGLLVMSEPIAWIEQGCDLNKDIVPAVQAVAHRSKPNSISSWRYFSKPVADAKARREAPMPEGRGPPGGGYQSSADREVERHRKLMSLLEE